MHESNNDLGLILGHVGSAISASAIIGVLTGILPLIGVLMAIVWYSIAISETKTVKNWWHARQIRRAKVNTAKAAFRIMELQKEIAEAQNELNHFKSDTAHVEQRSLPHFSESTAHDEESSK